MKTVKFTYKSTNYVFKQTKTKIEDMFIYRLKGAKYNCIELTIYLDQKQSVLQDVYSRPDCTVNKVPERALGSALVAYCIALAKSHKVSSMELADRSAIHCNICSPNLCSYYMVTRGKTWYETFGFKLTNLLDRENHAADKQLLKKMTVKNIKLKDLFSELHGKYKTNIKKSKYKSEYQKRLDELERFDEDICDIIDNATLLLDCIKKISKISCCIVDWLGELILRELNMKTYFGSGYVKNFRYREKSANEN
jgi:N-acetylglutamate synthase-like GNAT family acetyltransferase